MKGWVEVQEDVGTWSGRLRPVSCGWGFESGGELGPGQTRARLAACGACQVAAPGDKTNRCARTGDPQSAEEKNQEKKPAGGRTGECSGQMVRAANQCWQTPGDGSWSLMRERWEKKKIGADGWLMDTTGPEPAPPRFLSGACRADPANQSPQARVTSDTSLLAAPPPPSLVEPGRAWPGAQANI